MIRPRAETHQPAEQVEIRAIEQAIPVDGRDGEGLDTLVRDTPQGIDHRAARGVRSPALADRLAGPDIEGDDDPPGAMPSDEAPDEGRLLECGGPDHDPLGTRVQDGRDARLVAEAATDLDAHPAADLGDDRRHDGRLPRLPGAGPVEIDHVQPGRAGVGEGPSDRSEGRRRRPSRGRSRPPGDGPRGRRGGRSPAAARTVARGRPIGG